MSIYKERILIQQVFFCQFNFSVQLGSDSLCCTSQAAKAALVNFYETLRFELKDDVGVTIATHGWIGSEMTSGKFMLEEGAEMQWKEEREVSPCQMVPFSFTFAT